MLRRSTQRRELDNWTDDVVRLAEKRNDNKLREGGYLTVYVGFSMHLLGLSSEAGRNPLETRASSAALYAQGTATELGRERVARRNIPMAACPAAQSARKTLGRRRAASQKK